MDCKELVLAGVDVRDMMDRFMNNTRLVRMIIGKFLEDKTFLQLKTAVEAGDMKAAEFACHSLKGVCGNLSLKRLFEMLQEQLRLFRSGDAEAAAAMMGQIVEEYENAATHLQLWLAREE